MQKLASARLGLVCLMLSAGLTLSGCNKPPASAYEAGLETEATSGTPIGQNTAGESCNSQRINGGVDIYCGTWDQPSATVHNGGAASPDDLANLARTSPWRASLEGAYACNQPEPATILNGIQAELLTCTQRLGGWPHVALVSVINGTAYEADGVAPALPPMQRAIGVLSGRIDAADASKASAGSDSILAQRLAAQAFSSGDIGKYQSLMQLGSKANQAEDFPSAVIAYRAALALQQGKIGASNPGTVGPMLELALNLSDDAQFPEAQALFATAKTLVPQSTDPTAAPKLLHYEGLHELNQNHYETAYALLKQAQTAYAALLPPELLRPQPNGSVNSALFNVSHSGAGSNFLANQTQLNSPVTQGALLGLIEVLRYEALALRGMNKPEMSAQVIALSDSIANSNDVSPPILSARLDRTQGSLDAADGHNGAAAAQLADAQDNFNAAIPGSRPVAETELLQGAAEGGNGNQSGALASCRSGIGLLKELRLGTSPDLIAPCLDVFYGAASQSTADAPKLYAEMFEAAELAQGSTTAREIGAAAARLSSSSSNPKAAAAIRAQQDAAAKLASLYQQRDEFTKAPASAQSAGLAQGITLASLDKQIADTNNELRQDDLAVQAAAPNFGQLVQQVVSASDVLKALRPNEGFLGVTTTPKKTWLFLLHANSVRVAGTQVNDAQMTKLVSAIRASIEPANGSLPAFDMADAYTIYGATVAPFSADMTDIHELVVAPSGPLLALPFALLPTAPADPNDLGKTPWLVRQTNLAYVPAASNFVSLRKIEGTSAATQPWFGFGDFQPVSLPQAQATYNPATCGESAAEFAALPHLPYAVLELKAAAAIFGASPQDELLGTDFTVPKVEKADLKNFRILHFATHALLPTDLPCQNEPAIVTSAPAGATSSTDALLNTGDVTNLHLDANLVLLSACNTGGGADGGEALTGLARSFFYAGARALMVTQWSVNDQVSAYLVADTLSRLHSGAAGGPAGSLRAAQIAIIDSAGHGAPSNLANPFFWAAFSVIGDGGQPANSRLSALSGQAPAGL